MSDATLCAVCSSPLPEQPGAGRRRKTCPDDVSPTPGGCARWRHNEQRLATLDNDRPGTHRHSQPNPFEWFPTGGWHIERHHGN